MSTSWDTTAHTNRENRVHWGIADARTVRYIAKRAGLGHLIDRVTASRSRTFVGLPWSEVREDEYSAKAGQLLAALQAAYAEHGLELEGTINWRGSITLRRYARAPR